MSSGGTGIYVQDELVYQGANLASANAKATVYGWNATTRNLDIVRVMGTFANNTISIGATSNARFTSATLPDDTYTDNTAFEDIVDNTRIQTEANSIIDFSEHNPFGEP
jgi:hypothetical protein